ncbi:hypothetical protein vseg_020859 [Gypsophila vaccaria]
MRETQNQKQETPKTSFLFLSSCLLLLLRPLLARTTTQTPPLRPAFFRPCCILRQSDVLITVYLKNKLKFEGFVISDWEGIDRITSPPHANYSYFVQASVMAGIDMVMIPMNYQEFIDILKFQVTNNIILMSIIDDAVTRILRVKFVMGLFENPMAYLSLVNSVGSREHRELAREAVRKSLVLLNNVPR